MALQIIHITAAYVEVGSGPAYVGFYIGRFLLQCITEPSDGLILSAHIQHTDQSQTDVGNSRKSTVTLERCTQREETQI